MKLLGLLDRLRNGGRLKQVYPMLVLHLYSLSTAATSPSAVVEMAGNSNLALADLSKIFSKISLLVSKWNYTLHKAAALVAERIREKNVKGFLQRLAHSLNMGVSLDGFMKIEYEKFLSTCMAEFDRSLEKTKKYIEAYSALLTSSAFLSVSMLLTSMIYGMDMRQVLLTTTLMLSGSLAALVFLIARAMPPDPVIHSEPAKPQLLLTLETLNTPIAVASFLAAIAITLSTLNLQPSGNLLIDSLTPIPLAFTVAGIPPLIVGRMGRRWVKKAENLDEHYASFVKSLGDALEVTGSLKGACKILMMNDYGSINKLIQRLYKRLQIGFQQHKALNRFGLESLSTLILKMSRIIADNLLYGSRASIYTKAVHDYSIKHLINRKKRRQVAGSLKGIAIPLQATLVAIAALISVLTKILSKFAALIAPWFPVIAAVPQSEVSLFFTAISSATALASAAALYYVEGDSKFTLTYNLGLLLALSGGVYYAASAASESLFRIFTQFEEGMTSLFEGM